MRVAATCVAVAAVVGACAGAADVTTNFFVACPNFNAATGVYGCSVKQFDTTVPATEKGVVGTLALTPGKDTTGWDRVVITQVDNPIFNNVSQYGYALGYLESYVTFADIYNNYYNTVEQYIPAAGTPTTDAMFKWVADHKAYMRSLAANANDDFTFMLARLLSSLDGMTDGYKAGCLANNNNNNADCNALPADKVFLMNFQAELGDIMTAFNYTGDTVGTPSDPLPRRNITHCSAMIKPVADDIFFSHVTWSGYNSMLRQYKTYNFGGKQYVTMSGYAGVIMSIDDWYMTGSRLAVMETTNGVYNNTLFTQNLAPNPNVVSYFLRVMIANYLATSSPNWVEIFVTHNSGTYNNQWMVLDMNVVSPGTPFPKDALWIVETLPILYESADVSEVVNTQGYWGSYNIPYFPYIYNISGNLQMYEADGNFYSYSKYARAEIFARNHSLVKNLDDFKAMMRYNNFKEDPLSRIQDCAAATNGTCNPPYSSFLTIASRGDLNPAGGESAYGVNWAHLTLRQHAATDAKIATYKNMMSDANSMTGVVVNGPTTSGGRWAPFQWSTSPWNNDGTVRRVGLVDLFNFTFEDFATDAPSTTATREVDGTVRGIGYGIAAVGGFTVLLTVIALVYFAIHERSKKNADAGAAYTRI